MVQSLTAAERIPSIPKTAYEIVDDLSYPQKSTEELWKPMAGTKPVSVVEVGCKKALRMPCNFRGTKIDRASWDHNIKLDLTMCKGLQFLFYCHDASAVASFSVYMHSGDGWYRGQFDATATALWTPVRIYKKDMDIEGRPAGWGNVDIIRISAWRGQDVDTEFYITAFGLFGRDGKIIVVRGDSAASQAPNELEAVKQYTGIMTQFLDRAGLSYIVLSDLDVTAARLKKAELVIFPHNPKMPDMVADEIAKFLQAGGKLIACYHLPNRLESVVGIRSTGHIPQHYRGYFDSIRPSDKSLEGLPNITRQVSWNIQEALPVKEHSYVAAWWYSDNGQPTGKPAIIVSNNCIYLTHVLLPDDRANKLQLLLAMVGKLVPELWGQAASACIERIGRFWPYENYDTAYGSIKECGSSLSDSLSVLQSAHERRKEGMVLLSERKFSQAILAADEAQKSMIDAYCLIQKPLLKEHRAFWCHSAFGVEGMDWDHAIKALAENGFTAILPNMLWGGVAFYKSDVLPVSPAVAEKGDQISLCVTACRKYGIQCYIWKVNYNMGWATNEAFIAQMKAQNRTQVNYDGLPNDRWLCPSHPENQKLEIESMLEVARKYDVDGLHFDYIRYPGSEGCFCNGCRTRFEEAIGRKINNWPSDVRNDENLAQEWLDFRRQQITTVVAAIAGRAKKIRPSIKISAAVFRNWPVDRNSVGQDWKLWCDRGYLDFVCPMDYTPSSSQFKSMVEQQLAWAGKIPCYPGIGLSTWSDSTDICKLIEQIKMTRQLSTGGFTVFNYGPTEATQILPLLGKGMTRKERLSSQ